MMRIAVAFTVLGLVLGALGVAFFISGEPAGAAPVFSPGLEFVIDADPAVENACRMESKCVGKLLARRCEWYEPPFLGVGPQNRVCKCKLVRWPC